MTSLSLAFGLQFPELYTRDGLLKLDGVFLKRLRDADPALADRLDAGRADQSALAIKAESELLIAIAPHLEDFLVELFGIRSEVSALSARHHELAPVYECRRLFVQRKALRQVKEEEAAKLDGAALEKARLRERSFVQSAWFGDQPQRH